MSREYCRKTPVRKMGFSQKASCKAQGLLARTSRKNRGRFIISAKYKKSAQSVRNSSGRSLFSDGKKKPRIVSGYGTRQKALETIRNLKGHPRAYQLQIVNTMYNRAKYHKYQTQGMREAMQVYRKWKQAN